jgi:2-polyprenyl-3-methyl-5-hydroxy-6-metoxy-1,4-benzoquinol methylase
MFLSLRSYQKELLDNDNIPFEDLRQNMKELDFINTWLGGHNITIEGVKKLLSSSPPAGKMFTICEIGCGGGDNLRAIDQWATKQHIAVQLTGIDKKKECIDLAKAKSSDEKYSWVCAAYEIADIAAIAPDIIFSSLFCHHFTDDEMVTMLQWMKRNSNTGFFINDLHRHVIAYASIKALTGLFSKSYLVKNDAPLSVKRGFRRKDWQDLMQRAGIQDHSICWKWAFRWLIIGK